VLGDGRKRSGGVIDETGPVLAKAADNPLHQSGAMPLMCGERRVPGAAASLRRVSRKPHVVVCENRKNKRL
jgi:hypothetical protein